MRFHLHRVCGWLESYSVTLPIKFNLLSLNSNCFLLPNFCLERVILWSRFFFLEFRQLIFTRRPHRYILTQLTATSATWTDDIDLWVIDWTDKSSNCRLFIKTLTCTIATPQQKRFCNLRLNLTLASSRFLGTKHCNLKNTKTCASLVGDERNPTRVFLNLLAIVLMNGGSTIIHIIQIAKKDMCQKTWSIMSHSSATRTDWQYLLIGSVNEVLCSATAQDSSVF